MHKLFPDIDQEIDKIFARYSSVYHEVVMQWRDDSSDNWLILDGGFKAKHEEEKESSDIDQEIDEIFARYSSVYRKVVYAVS